MNVHGRHRKCREGDNCTGTGCRISTGKTKRKQNWKRPRLNHHTAEAGLASTSTKKGEKK